MKNLNSKNLEIEKLVLNSSRNEIVPEDFLAALVEWKEKKYSISKIISENDINRFARDKKVFVIPRIKIKRPSIISFSIMIGIMNIVPLFFHTSSSLLYMTFLFYCWYLPIISSSLLLGVIHYYKNRIECILIGPNGIFYTKILKRFGFISWNSIIDVKKSITYDISGDLHVECKFFTKRSEKKHVLFFSGLEKTEIPNFEIFYKLIYQYWIIYRNKTTPANKRPPINIYVFYLLYVFIVIMFMLIFLFNLDLNVECYLL